MITAGEMILKYGIVLTSDVFKTAFLTVTYHSVNAKRRLLQMPVIAIHVKGVREGQTILY